MLVDTAVSVAYGATTISDVAVLADQAERTRPRRRDPVTAPPQTTPMTEIA